MLAWLIVPALIEARVKMFSPLLFDGAPLSMALLMRALCCRLGRVFCVAANGSASAA